MESLVSFTGRLGRAHQCPITTHCRTILSWYPMNGSWYPQPITRLAFTSTFRNVKHIWRNIVLGSEFGRQMQSRNCKLALEYISWGRDLYLSIPCSIDRKLKSEWTLLLHLKVILLTDPNWSSHCWVPLRHSVLQELVEPLSVSERAFAGVLYIAEPPTRSDISPSHV